MGIGTDIIKVDRFEVLVNNKNFLAKNFNKDEIEYIKKRNNNLSTIAGIYASKEAFLKAIKKGINDHSLLDIEIYHDSNNAPYIKLHGTLEKNMQNKKYDLSISHDGSYIISVVIVY